MSQLEDLSKQIAKQTDELTKLSAATKEKLAEVTVAQDTLLKLKTELSQLRAAGDGLTFQRDQNLKNLKNLTRIALGEFVPLEGDPDDH